MNRNRRLAQSSSSDSDDDDNNDDDEVEGVGASAVASTSRERRYVNCDSNSRPNVLPKVTWPPAPNTVGTNVLPKVTWPPAPNTVGTYNWRHLRPTRPGHGHPLSGNKMQLFSRTNFNLAVYADGKVRGTRDDNDLHSHLELISAGYPGHVRIQGLLTKFFVAMDARGRLYGEPDVTEEAIVFIEAFQGSYNTYLSRNYAHLGWYLGIKKSGKFKKGCKTTYRQKAVMFLPRRSKFA